MSAGRVSVSRKIFLIAASFSIPLAVLTYLVIVNINANIEFASQELKGDEYQRPLEDALEHVQAAQLMFNAGQAEEVARHQKEADTAFAQIADVDRRIGVDLQFTEEGLAKRGRDHQRVDLVAAEWGKLKNLPAAPNPEIMAAFDHIASDLRTMITHAGDTSNLILDPDLDSYYLMDVTLLALPQTQDRLARVINFAGDVLKRGQVTEEE